MGKTKRVKYAQVHSGLVNGRMMLAEFVELAYRMQREAEQIGLSLADVQVVVGPSIRHPAGSMMTPISWYAERGEAVDP